MPNYDDFCPTCQKRVSIFQSYKDYGVKPVACPECSHKYLKRLISRVRVMQSEVRRMEDLSVPSFLGDVDE
ncbi:MAG: FmdB family zinc ribbon protein, partial [Anaerolineales bacterium]